MSKRKGKWVIACLCIVTVIGCAGYPVKERKARDMLNRALLLYQQGESESADVMLSDIRDNYADTAAATEAIRMLLGQEPGDYAKTPCAPAECMDAILDAAVDRAEKIGTSEAKKDVITLAVLLGKYVGDGEMPSFPPSLDDYDEDYTEGESGDERVSDPALETVKNAYMAAMAFFLDKPKGVATLTELEDYGFEVPAGVTFKISDGREKNLAITAWSEKGLTVYSIDAEGEITETLLPGAERPTKGGEGPRPGPVEAVKADKTAESDIKNAYVAAQIFFVDNPKGQVTLERLREAGFRASEGVTAVVEKGGEDSLSIKTWHEKGATVFHIDAAGGITREPRK